MRGISPFGCASFGDREAPSGLVPFRFFCVFVILSLAIHLILPNMGPLALFYAIFRCSGGWTLTGHRRPAQCYGFPLRRRPEKIS